jgi:transmembrane sensor
MDKKEFLKLLNKYNQGKANAEEIAFLEAYYNLFEQNEEVLLKVNQSDKNILKQSISSEIKKKMLLMEEEEETQLVSFFTKWRWLAAASVFVAVCTLGFLLLKPAPKPQMAKLKSKVTLQDIAPGSNQAVLTLANGESITLNDKENGVLAKQAGVVITKNRDGLLQYVITADAEPAINTISTPRGGQYQLILADGTKVWLNAASSITFPTKFNGDERKVKIEGEAYFEVVKNLKKPFRVVSKNQVIEVLGTHFNVNTYDDEFADKTTLLEGSVRVSKLDANGKIQLASAKVLKPGEQASLAANQNNILVSIADEEEAIAWKNGYFKFNKVDIQTMMRQVSRWYNVDVVFKGAISKDLFVGKINRSEHVSGVLRILELSKINVEINGRTIIISN